MKDLEITLKESRGIRFTVDCDVEDVRPFKNILDWRYDILTKKPEEFMHFKDKILDVARAFLKEKNQHQPKPYN